jgi:hypothetical protein
MTRPLRFVMAVGSCLGSRAPEDRAVEPNRSFPHHPDTGKAPPRTGTHQTAPSPRPTCETSTTRQTQSQTPTDPTLGLSVAKPVAADLAVGSRHDLYQKATRK